MMYIDIANHLFFIYLESTSGHCQSIYVQKDFDDETFESILIIVD